MSVNLHFINVMYSSTSNLLHMYTVYTWNASLYTVNKYVRVHTEEYMLAINTMTLISNYCYLVTLLVN